MPKRKKYNYLDLVKEDSYTRNFNLELYESWNTDDLKELKEKDEAAYDYKTCNQILEFIEDNYTQYGYIKHDKDIWTFKDKDEKGDYMAEHGYEVGQTKKTHYHVTIKFKNPRYKSTVCKELGVPFDKVVRCVSVDGSLKYDLHLDEDDKWPYDLDEFKGPLKDRLAVLVAKSITEEERSNRIIDLIISQSWKLPNLMREINKQGLYSHFIRGASVYKTILEESNMGMYNDVEGSYNFNPHLLAKDYWSNEYENVLIDGKIDLSKLN